MEAQKLFNRETHLEVELPADMVTFRGDVVHVKGIAAESSPGRSGKLLIEDGGAGRTMYPTVVGCYLAVEPTRLGDVS